MTSPTSPQEGESPRTNKEEEVNWMQSPLVVPSAFARTLERELAEARQEVERLRNPWIKVGEFSAPDWDMIIVKCGKSCYFAYYDPDSKVFRSQNNDGRLEPDYCMLIPEGPTP